MSHYVIITIWLPRIPNYLSIHPLFSLYWLLCRVCEIFSCFTIFRDNNKLKNKLGQPIYMILSWLERWKKFLICCHCFWCLKRSANFFLCFAWNGCQFVGFLHSTNRKWLQKINKWKQILPCQKFELKWCPHVL